ncbi:MAG TPA: hypothetical protein VG253_26375 [Streptosporangiaceae bacterium]|nr:hypothetical protein [Streptosporangiaceae bacterium]
MQATVRNYDAGSRSGTVFTDEGTVLPFTGTAMASSGLRLLRPGQRVRIARQSDGAITAITLATFPLPAVNQATGKHGAGN